MDTTDFETDWILPIIRSTVAPETPRSTRSSSSTPSVNIAEYVWCSFSSTDENELSPLQNQCSNRDDLPTVDAADSAQSTPDSEVISSVDFRERSFFEQSLYPTFLFASNRNPHANNYYCPDFSDFQDDTYSFWTEDNNCNPTNTTVADTGSQPVLLSQSCALQLKNDSKETAIVGSSVENYEVCDVVPLNVFELPTSEGDIMMHGLDATRENAQKPANDGWYSHCVNLNPFQIADRDQIDSRSILNNACGISDINNGLYADRAVPEKPKTCRRLASRHLSNKRKKATIQTPASNPFKLANGNPTSSSVFSDDHIVSSRRDTPPLVQTIADPANGVNTEVNRFVLSDAVAPSTASENLVDCTVNNTFQLILTPVVPVCASVTPIRLLPQPVNPHLPLPTTGFDPIASKPVDSSSGSTRRPPLKTVGQLLLQKREEARKRNSKRYLHKSGVNAVTSVRPLHGGETLLWKPLTAEVTPPSAISSSGVVFPIPVTETSSNGRSSITEKQDIARFPLFRVGSKVNAREFRPKHFDLLWLEIGSFKVKGERDCKGKMQHKFKVLFSRKQFVYEFSVASDAGVSQSLACLVVPFETVTAMSCRDQRVNIRVGHRPQMHLGNKYERVGVALNVNLFDTTRAVDVTGGEAAKHAVHRILLGKNQANKLSFHLGRFDPLFEELLTVPMEEEGLPTEDGDDAQAKLLPDSLSEVQKHGTQSKQPRSETFFFPAKVRVCSCRASCRWSRCSCARSGQKCNVGRSVCLCTNCDNPLNVIESAGVDPKLAAKDACLFQNVYQIKQLRRHLRREICLPCCDATAQIRDCIPLRVLCPNTECSEIVEYSWCRGVVCWATRNPRNHCEDCNKCCFSMDKHRLNCK